MSSETKNFPVFYLLSFIAHIALFILFLMTFKPQTTITFNSSEINIVEVDKEKLARKVKKMRAVRKYRKKVLPAASSKSGLKITRKKPSVREEIHTREIQKPEKSLYSSSDVVERRAPNDQLQDSRVIEERISENSETVSRIQNRSEAQATEKNGASSKFKWLNNSLKRVLVYEPRFAVPAELKGKGIVADVWAKFLVDQDGKVISVTIIKSSGYGALDRAVKENIKNHRFQKITIQQKSQASYKYTFAPDK